MMDSECGEWDGSRCLAWLGSATEQTLKLPPGSSTRCGNPANLVSHQSVAANFKTFPAALVMSTLRQVSRVMCRPLEDCSTSSLAPGHCLSRVSACVFINPDKFSPCLKQIIGRKIIISLEETLALFSLLRSINHWMAPPTLV